MRIIKNGDPGIIMSNPRSRHNYFGWPTVAKLQNGRIENVTIDGADPQSRWISGIPDFGIFSIEHRPFSPSLFLVGSLKGFPVLGFL